MLNVIDEFTHECLAIRVSRRLKSIDVIDVRRRRVECGLVIKPHAATPLTARFTSACLKDTRARDIARSPARACAFGFFQEGVPEQRKLPWRFQRSICRTQRRP
jgi:hypothetical protein